MSVGVFLTFMPTYSVWSKGLKGKAALKEAEWDRQIEIKEAEAKFESATHLAKAEVERAKGVAEANQIIGEGLKDNAEYLTYLWIKGLNDGTSEVIYIPIIFNISKLSMFYLSST